jgi:hypothetical protein
VSIESQAVEILNTLMAMDDATLEEGYDDFIKAFDLEENMEQAIIEKIAYCRAHNLTEDDLISEVEEAKEMLVEELDSFSPIKQRLLTHIILTSTKVNEQILRIGLYPQVNVRVQQLEHNERLPEYKHELGDSGMDIYATEDILVEGEKVILAPTGIKVAIPLGYELQVRPRSGIYLNEQYL